MRHERDAYIAELEAELEQARERGDALTRVQMVHRLHQSSEPFCDFDVDEDTGNLKHADDCEACQALAAWRELWEKKP